MPRVFLRWIAPAALALAIIVFILARWFGSAVPVVSPERRELVQSLVVTGRVLAPARVEIGPLTAGNVAELRVDEGDVVLRGQLLLRLDDAEEQAALAQARAVLAEAQARRAQLRTVGLPQAAAAVRRAEAELEQARKQWERARALFERGATSAAALEDAERRIDVARAELERARLQQQGAEGGGAEARLARAAEASAAAALDLAAARFERTRIVAPVDGRILLREVELGDAVQPGQVLLVVGTTGATEVEITPDERNLAQLQVGQEALVSAEAFPNERFRAAVVRIAPTVDRQRGTIEVRLGLQDPPARLLPEMTVSADVEVARKADALVLPSSTVYDLATQQPWVLVIVEGRAVRREVHLGLRGDRLVEVVEGLRAGELVIAERGGVAPGDRSRAGERRPIVHGAEAEGVRAARGAGGGR